MPVELKRRIGTSSSTIIQICAMPPSTNNSIPVIKLLSSGARNRIVLATSSGVAIRPIGVVDTIVFLNWSSVIPRLLAAFMSPGVSIGPGLIALTRILRFFKSAVKERANERTAALVAL
jgi:hypothetical protein